MKIKDGYQAIVIGSSAGGLRVLTELLSHLPSVHPLPVIIVQHRSKSENRLLEEILRLKTQRNVKQADEKENIRPDTVYIAPPDYHLMIEMNKSFSLSSDEPVQYSRPSIDVLFSSAAEVYGKKLIGIILTGANRDGENGIRAIHKSGGCTIVQDPGEAEYTMMPSSAISTGVVDHVLPVKEIIRFLLKVA